MRSDLIKFPLILTRYQKLVEIPEEDYGCGLDYNSKNEIEKSWEKFVNEAEKME